MKNSAISQLLVFLAVMMLAAVVFAANFNYGESAVVRTDATPTPTATATPTPTPTGPAITGTITYGDTGRAVPNAVLWARWSGGGVVMNTTDAQGQYELRGFQPDGTYTITPARNGKADGAVSSFDASMIAQYAAGMRTFTPLQMLAADVSGDGDVTSFDAALAGQLSVGVMPSHVLSMWMFVPGVNVHTNITFDVFGENYKAILIGDVSQNWVVPSPTANLTPTPIPMPSAVTPCPTPVCQR